MASCTEPACRCGFSRGIDVHIDETTARQWASRRWGVQARTATTRDGAVVGITVLYRGREFTGLGPRACCPPHRSPWWLAACDLLNKEGLALAAVADARASA